MSAKSGSRGRTFSYAQFRQVTDLSKKEADSWVSRGLIRANLSGDGRRRIYDYNSLSLPKTPKALKSLVIYFGRP